MSSNENQQSIPKTCQWKDKIWLFIYIVIVIAVSLFGLSRSSMIVKIQLTASDVSFNFLRKEGHPLFNDIWVKKARFVHFKKFIIPFDRVEMTESSSEKELMSSVSTDIRSKGEATVLPMDYLSSIIFDDILFSELYLEKNARVSLSMSKNEYPVANILISGVSTMGKIDIKKEQYIESQHCQWKGLQAQVKDSVNHLRIFNQEQKKIDFSSSKNILNLNLELEKKQALSEGNIYIKNPAFVKRDRHPQMTSIVKPGKIVLKGMADKEIPIEPHDFVVVQHKEPLQVTRMESQDDGIQLVLIGEVDGLKTGTKDHLINKLPSKLEFLSQNNPLILYLNIVIFLIPAAILLHRRIFKKSDEGKKTTEGDKS